MLSTLGLVTVLLAFNAYAQCNNPCDEIEFFEGDDCGVDPNDGSSIGIPVEVCPCQAEQLSAIITYTGVDGSGRSALYSISLFDYTPETDHLPTFSYYRDFRHFAGRFTGHVLHLQFHRTKHECCI